jgi:hypothetical protein
VKNKRKKLPTKISSRRIAQDSEKRSPAATVTTVNTLFITFPFTVADYCPVTEAGAAAEAVITVVEVPKVFATSSSRSP